MMKPVNSGKTARELTAGEDPVPRQKPRGALLRGGEVDDAADVDA
jgi:hypothetical protein